MASDPELRAHQEWLGFVQPVGLVVSPPGAGQRAGARRRNIARDQRDAAAPRARGRRGDDGTRRVRLPTCPHSSRSSSAGSRATSSAGRRAGPCLRRSKSSVPTTTRRSRPTYAVRSSSRDRSAVAAADPAPRRPAPLTTPREDEAGAGRPARRHASSGCSARPGADRAALQRHAAAARLRAAAARSSGHLTFPSPTMLHRRRPADLRRAADAARRPSACSASRRAAPAGDPRREPQVPERGLDGARRAGAGGPVRAAPRLPGGRRRTGRASCCARCCASDPTRSTAGCSRR